VGPNSKNNDLSSSHTPLRGVCADGQFGAMMEVELVNDGPVTLQIDSRDK
jgi:D-Tyr-tRNAtyr deacylase